MPAGIAVEPLQGSLWLGFVNKSVLVIRWAFEGACMSLGWFHGSCQEDYGGAAELGGRTDRVTSLVLSNSGDSSGQPLEGPGAGRGWLSWEGECLVKGQSSAIVQ